MTWLEWKKNGCEQNNICIRLNKQWILSSTFLVWLPFGILVDQE